MQVVGDVVIATGLVYLSGGADSPLTFLLAWPSSAPPCELDGRGALWVAVSGAVAFSGLVVVLRLSSDAPMGPVFSSRGLFVLGSNLLALALHRGARRLPGAATLRDGWRAVGA